MQSIQKAIIGLLIIAALALGFAILSRKTPSNVNNTSNNPIPPPASQNADAGLSEDEKKLFNSPAQNASAEEKRAHYDLAVRMSTESDKLEIKNCVATPVVMRVRLNSTFSVKNSGSNEIEFGFDKKVKIAPGNTVQVKADFKNGVGLYGYGCSDQQLSRAVGFLIVMPAK